MIESFPFYLSIIVVIVLLIMLANKIKVAYPVLLVVAGLVISLISGIPTMRIDPELIFIIFLPPYCMKLPGVFPGKNCGDGAVSLQVLLL